MERRSDRVARWLLPTLGGLLVLLAYAFTLFLRKGGLFAGDGDPGRHIRLGNYIIENGSIPRVDVFSHTMQGREFIPFEWLSEVVFAAADAVAGLAGVTILTGLLFAAAVGLVYAAIRRAGVPAPLAFGFGLLAFLLQAMHLHPRPHMFTTALVALFSLTLIDVRRGSPSKRLLALPVLMVFWVNLHGGFLVGFILIGAFLADSAIRSARERNSAEARLGWWLLATLAACLMASLLNPAGWALWPHTTGYLGETFLVDFTQEYQSPDFHDALLQVFLGTLMLGTIVLALLRSPIDALGLFLWVLFASFSLHSARNIPLFGVVCVPWLAAWAWRLVRESREAGGRPNGLAGWALAIDGVEATLPGWPVLLVGLVALTGGALARADSDVYEFSSDVFPVAAVEYLQDTGFVPPGPVYQEFAWGGYLLYAWPTIPVFIDGQTDFYGEKLTREYLRIRNMSPDWDNLLEVHGIRWALIPPQVALNQGLEQNSAWGRIYQDSTAAVWVRTEQ